MKKLPGKLLGKLFLSLLLGVSLFFDFNTAAQTLDLRRYTGIVIQGITKVTYSLQATTNLALTNSWVTLTNVVLPTNQWLFIDYDSPQFPARHYRAVLLPPSNTVFVAGGSFQMGDTFNEGSTGEVPVHAVQIDPLFVDPHPVSGSLWNSVYEWAINNGYSFSGSGYAKATNHPATTFNWYDAVKWCNARSESEGKIPAYYTSPAQTTVYRAGEAALLNSHVKFNAGYRLPTEAEWEKIARGGVSGRRFSWSDADTITHGRANYESVDFLAYDISPTRGYHPIFSATGPTYTSPVGYFAANGHGVYDTTGNVWQFCWDWYDTAYYAVSPAANPRGPLGGTDRVVRGGSYFDRANVARVAARAGVSPTTSYPSIGLRCVLPPGGL